MLPLTDLDPIIYRTGWAFKHNFIQAIEYGEYFLYKIWDKFEVKPQVFLSGKGNFRYAINPEYKANRNPNSRPPYYHELRDYFIRYWDAVVTVDYEADDYLGALCKEDCVICTIDKDLNTIPGHKFNYVKDEFYCTTEEESAFYFWKQMLTGDVSDNIKGIKGIGEVKSLKLLENLSVNEMKEVVTDIYLATFGGLEQFEMNARCLFIKRASLTSEYYHFH